MNESLKGSKEGIQKVLENLRGVSTSMIPRDDIRNVDVRIQMMNNILIQNEKKIWLRSKDGREILTEIKSSVDKLIDDAMVLQKSPERDRWSNFIRTLERLESVLRKLEEESQKRSMVVT
ncbi:MAG: hypothetical protein ACUVV4_07345 [Candidatus Bathyarchaeia archaeon]